MKPLFLMVGCALLSFGDACRAMARQANVFPAGGAVEARLMSNAGQAVGGIHYYRPDFSVWLQVRVRNAPGGANLGVGRVTGPSGPVPASITLTGQGTLERGSISSDSGLRGRADDFRMLTYGPLPPVLTGIEPSRGNAGATSFQYSGPLRSSYANGYWTPNSIMGFDAIRAGAIYQVGSPPVVPESWSQYHAGDGEWSPWQNVYRVSVVDTPSNARFTISAVGSASIMIGTIETGAAGVYVIGAASTGLRAFSTTRTFQFIGAVPPASGMGPFEQPQAAFPRSASVPAIIPSPGASACCLSLAGVLLSRKRPNR